MSMRQKLVYCIIAAIVLNIILLFCYYNIFISDGVAGDLNSIQTSLDSETMQIAETISNKDDYQSILLKNDKQKILIFRIEDLSGNVLYQNRTQKMNSLYIHSVKPVEFTGEVYLLKIMQPLPEKSILQMPSLKNLFLAELLIIFVIMLLLSAFIYLRFVRPIEILQRNMAGYQGSSNVKRTRRLDEIGKLHNSFVQLTENLEEEKLKQNRIIASISHDIKTPLTSVMGYAERIKKGNFSAERTEKYVDTIYSKSLAIQDLIEEFDDYLSCNLKSSFKKQEITVSELMKIICMDYEDELKQIGVTFQTKISCPDVTVNVDISKLRRVFGNIISNSLKHFRDGEKNISISCLQQHNTIIFSVSDNGTGVPEELLETIFEPMFTSDEGRSVAGLGLAICKEIIKTHQGTIRAQNNKDGGLTILFYLPTK